MTGGNGGVGCMLTHDLCVLAYGGRRDESSVGWWRAGDRVGRSAVGCSVFPTDEGVRDVAPVVWGGVLGEEETVGVSLRHKEVADRLSVKWLSEAVKAGGLREGVRVVKGTVAVAASCLFQK